MKKKVMIGLSALGFFVMMGGQAWAGGLFQSSDGILINAVALPFRLIEEMFRFLF